MLARTLRGLDAVVSISFVQPHMGEHGWTFGPGGDPVLDRKFLYEVYTAARADYTGRASVPVLWDRQGQTIVSNESADIAEDFDQQFAALAGDSERLFPPRLRPAIDAMNAANYGPVSNGVYRAGFAASQQAHEEAARGLFARLDELDAHLAEHRYLCGEQRTAADWFLFPTLYRFDAVYHTHFKCNLRRLADYRHLWAYTRELYQVPGVRETCDPDKIKEHYYTSHESIHPRRYVPIGPQIDFDQPHGRDGIGGGA